MEKINVCGCIDLIKKLDILDSNKLCDYMIKKNATGKECFTDMGGLVKLGLQ